MIQLFVVTHKDYKFPLDLGYTPIWVGTHPKKTAHFSDNTGNNIAHLNNAFCELTALYWIWKNNNTDVIGLMHYRRYFESKQSIHPVKNKKIAHSQEFYNLQQRNTIVIAKPRNYIITTIKRHYCNAHHKADFLMLRNEIHDQFPQYLGTFDKVMNQSSLSLYNMFVAPRNLIEPYCAWLFDILFALEKKIPYQKYDSYQKRVFGFMAERLFNVWLEHHKLTLSIEYRRVINIEGENLIKKSIDFLKRNFLKRLL